MAPAFHAVRNPAGNVQARLTWAALEVIVTPDRSVPQQLP